jgi:hypothetical protein
MKGGSFGVWKNAPGSWLLGWSMASNSSDESSLFESSGKGVIGDAGCRRVHSMSDACGRGGSDMLRVCMREAGRNRGPGSVDSITLSNTAIASLCAFLRSLGLSTWPVVSEVSLAVGSSLRVRLDYRDEKAVLGMGKLCSKTRARDIYSTCRTATERENLGIWARDSLATREGAQGHVEHERRGAHYGLYARVIMNADTR